MSIALRDRNLPQSKLQAREALMAQFRPVPHARGLTERQVRASLDSSGRLASRR